MTEGRDHYSYTVYADPTTARQFDRQRFGSPIGQLVNEREAETFLRLAGPLDGKSVLDVGTGTGRIAMVFRRAGAVVTGIDASDEMLKVARERGAAERLEITFLNGDAHTLEFPAQSFDIVVSSRVLMHTPRWQRCIDEWCRVARDRVVVDYPSTRSFALLESLWRRTNHALGGSVQQPYQVFLDRPVAAAFERNGFHLSGKRRQFVLPIGLYRLLRSAAIARATEDSLRRAGLSRMFASPVTVLARRAAGAS